jgi:carbon storage regulator
MLVLTRRIGEAILIGADIRVTVVTLSRQRVRLGITAPLAVTVARSELVEDGVFQPRTVDNVPPPSAPGDL